MRAVTIDERVDTELMRLVALAPLGNRIVALARLTCARTMSLPPLPVIEEVAAESDAELAVVDFAEQFSADVASVTEEQRSRLFAVMGRDVFSFAILTYVADFVPRVRAGLQSLGLCDSDWLTQRVEWEHLSDPSDVLFNGFLPSVARLRALDPVTSELVRLRGATQHNCRVCKSVREGSALDAGGSETLYGEVERYETSSLLTERHRAALRYVDALIWSPSRVSGEVAAGVREHFSDIEAVELTFDVMRNASNKIAVALGGDAPRVATGTERYVIDAEGQTVFD